MSQADIDEWLGAQAGGVDENVLEAMRGIADQGAMRVPVARAAAVPPAPDRNAGQGETGLRWTASSSASGIEAWGSWSQAERDITLELPVADETRGKQVRWQLLPPPCPDPTLNLKPKPDPNPDPTLSPDPKPDPNPDLPACPEAGPEP